jgi:hypothetical protein
MKCNFSNYSFEQLSNTRQSMINDYRLVFVVLAKTERSARAATADVGDVQTVQITAVSLRQEQRRRYV